eukprot:4872991-Pleurochrysis_carterae.AAC.1
MESSTRNTDQAAQKAIRRYSDPSWGENIVLMCSTAKASVGTTGLDLVNTHATIVCGEVDAAEEQQM